MMNVQAVMMKKVKVSVREIIKGMQKIYIENGVTTVQDGATSSMAMKLLTLSNTPGRSES